jgi:ABC-type phosphate transport system permease subunit
MRKLSYLSSILSTMASSLGSIVFSSPVALDWMAAYSSKTFAEKRNRAKEVMLTQYF